MTGNNDNHDAELGINPGEQSLLDKAIIANRERKLTDEELSAFVKVSEKTDDKGMKVRPFIDFHTPSNEDGPKGYSIMIGIKGTF